LSKLLTLSLAAAAGYTAARALLEHELPDETPTALREPLERARAQLQRAREQARTVRTAARQASDDAARELLADYQRRTGRASSTNTDTTRATIGLARTDPSATRAGWRR
jgi:hypothetical protein